VNYSDGPLGADDATTIAAAKGDDGAMPG